MESNLSATKESASCSTTGLARIIMSPRCQSRGCSRELVKRIDDQKNLHMFITDSISAEKTKTLVKLQPVERP